MVIFVDTESIMLNICIAIHNVVVSRVNVNNIVLMQCYCMMTVWIWTLPPIHHFSNMS